MTRVMATSSRLVLFALAALASRAHAQATRADFADAYQRFETAYSEYRVSGRTAPSLAEVNRVFDEVTVGFFGGDARNAMRALTALTADVAGRARDDVERALESLDLRLEPPTLVGAGPFTANLRITSLYREDLEDPVPLALRVLVSFGGREEPAGDPIEITVDCEHDVDVRRTIALPERVKPQGTGSIRLVPERAETPSMSSRTVRFRASAESFDAMRKANAARIDGLRGATPSLEDAIACCRARNEQLRDKPSEMTTTQWLADPFVLADQLRREIDALSDSVVPYRRHEGDLWRTIDCGSRQPVRVFAPKAACGKEPVPLVIVLHGAGGDENMWLDGYGRGRIEQLAEQRGFLLASPLTYLFAEEPAPITLLIEHLAAEYPVDPARVYLIGHSLGGIAACRIVEEEPDLFAGAVCIAGVRPFAPGASYPPCLVVQGALDPISPPARARSIVADAKARGQPIELKEVPEVGHTLIVNDELDAAIEWLLTRKR